MKKNLQTRIDREVKFFAVEKITTARKIILLKNGEFMDLDEWSNIPYEGTSKTEDADFEILEQKRISMGDCKTEGIVFENGEIKSTKELVFSKPKNVK